MPIGQAKFGLLGGVADPGKLELIETQTASADSSVDFTDIKEDIYNVHFAIVNISLNGAGTSVNMRFFENEAT